MRTGHEKDISTEQRQAKADTRIPGAHVNPRRTRGHQEAPGQGSQAPLRLKTSGAEARDITEDHGQGDRPGGCRLRRSERLRQSAEYDRVKAEGRRLRTSHFGVGIAVNHLDHHRLGLVVQKRYWSAVGRNRIKRCIREFFRLNRHRIPLPGKDLVVIARPGAQDLNPAQIAEELLPVLLKQKGRS